MTDLSIFTSPKRKRELVDNPGRAASPLRLRMDIDQMPADTSDGHISQEFQDLRIHAPEPMQRLSFRDKALASLDAPLPAHPLSEDMEASLTTPTEPTSQPGSHQRTLSSAAALPRTPPLNPVSMSPLDTPRTMSPLSSLSDFASAAEPDAAHPSEPRLATPPSSSPSSQPTTPSRRRNRSPPPPSSDSLHSDLVWTAAEITGHNPTDPTDDGYGINGIGFRPTSAVAQQRAQRRRQQVAEWKTREAREARSRRAERRRSGFRGGMDRQEWRENQRRVRFVGE